MTSPTPTTDLAPADWLVASVTEFGPLVRQLMPAGFEAYLRIFHRPDQGRPEEGADTSWAEAARRYGTVLHPAAQWRPLTGRHPHPSNHESYDGEDPLEGCLDRLTLPRLASHLAGHTTTPEACHLGLWHGFGSLPESWLRYPVFHLPARDHWLFPPVPLGDLLATAIELELAGMEEQSRQPGGIRGLLHLGSPRQPFDARAFIEDERRHEMLQSPTWWWPDDRAWVVHSEIDLDSTLLAGSSALAAVLLDDPEVECVEVGPDLTFALGADLVNRP